MVFKTPRYAAKWALFSIVNRENCRSKLLQFEGLSNERKRGGRLFFLMFLLILLLKHPSSLTLTRLCSLKSWCIYQLEFVILPTKSWCIYQLEFVHLPTFQNWIFIQKSGKSLLFVNFLY